MRILQHDHVPRCLAYSPDGSLLAVGDEGGVTLYNLPAADVASRLHISSKAGDGTQGIETLAFSPDGKLLAAGAVTDLAVWEWETETLLTQVPGHDTGNRAVAWSPSGQEIASVGWDKSLRWWTPSLSESRPPLTAPEPIASLAFHARGNQLAGGGSHRLLVFCWWDDAVKKWHQHQPLELTHATFALAAPRTGKLLAAGHADGAISLWDFETRTGMDKLTGHEWIIYGLAFTPDGSRLVSGGADGVIKLWDVPHRRLIETYRFHKSWVTSVAVSPDGMTAAAASNDYTVVLWDLADV